MKNYFAANPSANSPSPRLSAIPPIILCFLLFLILPHNGALAMDPPAPAQVRYKVKRANAQHLVFRAEERTHQEEQFTIKYFLFNPSCTIKTPSEGEWRYYHNPDLIYPYTILPESFIPVSDPPHIGLFQPVTFFQAAQRPPGFYFFTTDRGENVTVIRYSIVTQLETPYPVVYRRPGNPVGIAVSATVQPENPDAQDPDMHILYEIENFDADELQVFDHGILIAPTNQGIFRADRNISIQSNAPRQITLHAGIQGRESVLNVTVEPRQAQSNLLLKNVNDSNNNHLPDCDEDILPQGPDDPEVNRLDIFQSPEENQQHLANLLRAPATYETVNNVAPKLTITETPNLRLHQTRNKTASMEKEIVLTTENRMQVIEKLSSIFLEGIAASDRENDATITLTLHHGETPATATWNFTVLHLYIDRSTFPASYQNRQNLFVPRAKNPSVIPVFTPEEQAALPHEQAALFQLGSSRPALLEAFKDSVEWRVNPLHAQIGLIPAVEPHPLEHHYSANGSSMHIYGIAPGDVHIGVRLQGSEADYLSFNCPVQTLKSLPVAFQFFPPGEYLPVHARTEGSIPAILHQMNRLVRQAGISFTPVNTQTANFIHETARFRFTLTEEIPGPGSQHVFYTPTPLEQIQGMLYPESKMAYIFPDIYDHEVGETFNKIAGTILRTKAGPQNGTYIAFDSYPMPFFPPAPLPADVALDLSATEYIHRPNGIVICEKTGFHFSTNWPYSMAYSSARNILTFNFLNSLETDAEYQMGAAVGIPAPSPLRIDTPEGPVDISFSPTYNKLPCLLDKNLLVACFDMDMIEKNILLHNPVPPAQALVAAALEMLGQKKRGLDGDLEHYNPQLQPQLLQSALQQNIILPLPLPPGAPPNTTPRYILNPIIPPTDHKNASITPYADILDINTLGQRGYKIDPIRTSLIHQHPLLNP